MAYNPLQNQGLILVRPGRDAAWHLTSAMATSTRFKAFQGHRNDNLECCFHLLPHHPWSCMAPSLLMEWL